MTDTRHWKKTETGDRFETDRQTDCQTSGARDRMETYRRQTGDRRQNGRYQANRNEVDLGRNENTDLLVTHHSLLIARASMYISHRNTWPENQPISGENGPYACRYDHFIMMKLQVVGVKRS